MTLKTKETSSKGLKRIRALGTLYSAHPALIAGILFTAAAASILEGLNMSLILPLFETFRPNQGAIENGISFDFLRAPLADLSQVQRVQMIAFFLIGITAIKSVFLYLNAVFTARFTTRTMVELRERAFHQLLNLSISHINQSKGSDLFTIITEYARTTMQLSSALLTSIVQFFSVGILLTVLLTLSWQLTILAIALLFVTSLILHSTVERTHRYSNSANVAMLEVGKMVLETIGGLKLVRIFSREDLFEKKFAESQKIHSHWVYLNARAAGALAPLFQGVSVLLLGVLLLLSSWILAASTDRWFEVLLAFLVVMFRLLSPVQAINEMRGNVGKSFPALDALLDFLNPAGKSYQPSGDLVFSGLQSEIAFKDVSFHYDSKEDRVLNGLNFSLKRGRRYGIVGQSGAGKSTLTELLLRFHDPQTGQVLVDGVPLSQYNVHTFRSHVGVVSQDTFLFNDSIFANITLYDPSYTRDEVIAAARKAHAHDFIMETPAGYDTLAGDRGVRLSGGQRQRIGIARAILKNPDILIFDEATSALDAQSEEKVLAAMEEVGRGRTTIVIAHRLSAVAGADEILVLEQGELREKGTHDELVAAQGIYSSYAKLQLLTGIRI